MPTRSLTILRLAAFVQAGAITPALCQTLRRPGAAPGQRGLFQRGTPKRAFTGPAFAAFSEAPKNNNTTPGTRGFYPQIGAGGRAGQHIRERTQP